MYISYMYASCLEVTNVVNAHHKHMHVDDTASRVAECLLLLLYFTVIIVITGLAYRCTVEQAVVQV